MSHDYEVLAKSLVSAFMQSGKDCEPDSAIMEPSGVVGKWSPTLLAEWERAKSAGEMPLYEFLDECARASSDTKLMRVWGDALNATVYYSKDQGEPSDRLIGQVANCTKQVLSGLGKVVSVHELIQFEGLQGVISELLAYYENPNDLAKRLVDWRPELRNWLLAPRPRRIRESPDFNSNRHDAPIPNYPAKSFVNKHTPESKAEIAKVSRDVDLDSLEPHIDRLLEIIGYGGCDVDTWKAIFVHDWHYIASLDSRRSVWRSTTVADMAGRQVFALLRKDSLETRWAFDGFLTADELLSETGLREARHPIPNYHLYDLLLYKLSVLKSIREKLEEDGLVNSISSRVLSGRDVQDETYYLLNDYVAAWDDIWDLIYAKDLVRQLKLGSNSVSIDGLIEQATAVLGETDYRGEWIELLRTVVSGFINCFQEVIPWGHPQQLDQDLQSITDASSNYDRATDWLSETTEFYVEMVATLAEGEDYESCGNSLIRIENHLGSSIEAIFKPLCNSIKKAKLPIQRLKAAKLAALGATDPLGPNPLPKTNDVVPDTTMGGKKVDDAIDTGFGVDSGSTTIPAVAEVRRSEPELSAGSESLWQPPTSGKQAMVDLVEVPAIDKRSSRDTLIEGCVQDYERSRQNGRTIGTSDLAEFDGKLIGESAAIPEDDLLSFLYVKKARSIDAFIKHVRNALEDEVRPDRICRLFYAFEDPDSSELSRWQYSEYCLLRVIAERLSLADDNESTDYLEYYAEQLVSCCEQEMLLEGDEIMAACEALLFLSTVSPSVTCLQLCRRFYSMLNTFGETAERLVLEILHELDESYVDSESLALELAKSRGSIELKTFVEYALKLTPDSYNAQYSGATFLWKWLIGPECEDRFDRVRNMIESMAGRREDYDASWCFSDDADISSFIDDSFVAEEQHAAKSPSKIVGSSKRNMIRKLKDISSQYERYCELRSSLESERYASKACKNVCSRLLSLHDLLSKQVTDYASWLGNSTGMLLSVYPAKHIPWGKEGSIDIDGSDSSFTDGMLSFIEFQQHRYTEGDLPKLVTEPSILETLSTGLSAYKNNVISSAERENMRHVLAGALGVLDYCSTGDREGDPDSIGILLASWNTEFIRVSLERSMDSALQSFRATIVKQIDDESKPDDSRKKWLREMLARIDNAERPDEILSYGDFLSESDVALPERPSSQPDDLLYGSFSDDGVYKLIRDDLIGQGGFWPTSRIAGITQDIRNDEIPAIRDCLTQIDRLVNNSPIPVDGNRRNTSSGEACKKVSTFCHYLTQLFDSLGFTWAKVQPVKDEEGLTHRFCLDFLSIPGATLPDGTLVCPLNQLVSLRPGTSCDSDQNSRLYIEVFTSVKSLIEGARRKDVISGGRRIALYVGHESHEAGKERLLTLRDRAKIASEVSALEDGTGFLLLDWVLVAYALHWEKGKERLGTFFRCSTQFTHLHPYVDKGLPSDERMSPSKGAQPSDQPPLFYGRSSAIGRISSFGERGAYLVYGARRMGKTSILREVEAIETAKRTLIDGVAKRKSSRAHKATLPDIAGYQRTIAAYCDLRGHTGNSVDEFWVQYVAVTLEKTVPGEIHNLKSSENAMEVKESLRTYMLNESTRILLLLDEADDMVQYDSMEREERNEQTSILSSLYGFVTDMHGSFKFVLSGLHATMRYSGTIPNKESGHMGDPQVISPLWEDGGYQEAYQLVYEPMKSMGIHLEHESILTIIRRAGYYPNLINQICEQLLATVRLRRDLWNLDSGPFVSVPDHIVNAVFADYDEKLKRNFQDTIALDPVYGTIIYAIAQLGTRNGWGPVGVKDIAPVIAEAFREDNLSDRIDSLDTYLRELERFRVLRGEERLYTIRDQEIRFMLDSFGEEGAHGQLLVAIKKYSMSGARAYHPEHARDQLGWLNDGLLFELSPINHSQVARINALVESGRPAIIVGSDEVGLNMLIQQALEQPSVLTPTVGGWDTVRAATYEDYASRYRRNDTGQRLCVIDGDWDERDVEAAARQDEGVSFIFFASPEKTWALRGYLNVNASGQVIRMTPWEPAIVRQWLKRIIVRPSDEIVSQVFRRTGGTHYLMHKLAGSMRPGISEQEITSILEGFAGRELLTSDLEALLDSNTCIRNVMLDYCYLGGCEDDEAMSVGSWYELLGGNCSQEEFLDIVSWLTWMSLASCADGQESSSVAWNTTISISPLISMAYQGEFVSVGGGDE